MGLWLYIFQGAIGGHVAFLECSQRDNSISHRLPTVLCSRNINLVLYNRFLYIKVGLYSVRNSKGPTLQVICPENEMANSIPN